MLGRVWQPAKKKRQQEKKEEEKKNFFPPFAKKTEKKSLAAFEIKFEMKVKEERKGSH